MPDVFAEFCAAGLWPGVGQATAARLAEAGISSPADVTAPKLAGLPRMTDRRANRLVTSFIGAGQLYQHRRTAGAARRSRSAGRRGSPMRSVTSRGGAARRPVAAAGAARRGRRAGRPAGRRDRTGRPPGRPAARPGAGGMDARPVRQGRPHRCAASRWSPTVCGRSGWTRSRRWARRWRPAGWCRVADPGGSDEPWIARKALAQAESTIAEGLARLVRTRVDDGRRAAPSRGR